MKLNPLVESSARRRMRSLRTPVVICAYLASLFILAAVQFSGFMGQGVGVAQMRQGMEGYIWMTALQFAMIILVAPALSAGSIAGERERQTFDLLLATGMGSVRIVLGKLMEHAAYLILLILLSAPFMSIALVTGGVGASDVGMTLLYLAVIALAALSVGMVMSVCFSRTLAAVIVSYLLIFALGAGTWALAKRGPLAADYSYKLLASLEGMPALQIIRTLPVTILLNPAVGLVMLLAGQTGILHRTMESTMRLYNIYSACKFTGFTPVALCIFVLTLMAAVAFTALACMILYVQTGARYRRGR